MTKLGIFVLRPKFKIMSRAIKLSNWTNLQRWRRLSRANLRIFSNISFAAIIYKLKTLLKCGCASASSQREQNDENGKKTEREKLIATPRLRSCEEIKTTYNKSAGDASSVDRRQARKKVLDHHGKLEKTIKQTEDLQNGAEDFAYLTNELKKRVESRKLWQI